MTPLQTEFICECNSRDCGSSLDLTLGEWKEIREQYPSSRFAVVIPAHTNGEPIVRAGPSYSVVEATDPR